MSGQHLPAVDSFALRKALGHFTTGVAVATILGVDGKPLGLTINSFSSVSLAPPIVAWNLQLSSANRHAFESASHFAINVLSQTQKDLSRRFASIGTEDRFAGLEWECGTGGVPVLDGAVAQFQCRMVSTQTVGDHVLFLGEVVRFCNEGDDLPLVYWKGSYRDLGGAPGLA